MDGIGYIFLIIFPINEIGSDGHKKEEILYLHSKDVKECLQVLRLNLKKRYFLMIK